MNDFCLRLWVALGMGFLAAATLNAAPEKLQLKLERHAPCNLFDTGEDVVFNATLEGVPAGRGQAVAVLTDETGKKIAEKNFDFDSTEGKPAAISINLGKPGRGYYELLVKAKVKDRDDQLTGASGKCSLGVMEFVNRSAKEVRDGNYIFGLKWWGGIKNQKEMEDAMVKLGLQWTRVIQNEGGKEGRLSIGQMLGDYPMNAVIKMERFPKEMFDDTKYGPIEEWEKKYGRGAWTIKTLPKKDLYQAYLRTQLAAIPADQKVFEIWNEPWDKMSPTDFAEISQWIADVILESRPDAIIGPNFYGRTSPYEYDAQVIKAGGLKRMKMVALHPYATSEDRDWLRDYRKWLKDQTGTDMEIYITEYGSHSTPQGPAKRSEMEQARRVVRQSLSLYAEGVKALIPHWAGQSEANPTYLEDWFGFVRLNEEPKPVLLAHANSARLIDGGTYLGDLWFGPEVGAMLFEKRGQHVLALWTLGEAKAGAENSSRKDIEIEPGPGKWKLVDILGRESSPKTEGGKLKLTLDEAPVYLVGDLTSLVPQATKELRADRWPKPAKPQKTERVAKKLKSEPVLDGKFNDWSGAAQLAMINPKVNGFDCSGTGYLSWDENYFYVGVDLRDNEMMNKESRAKLYRNDSVEVFVSLEPRDAGSGFGPKDLQFFIAPTSGEGKPIVGQVTDREAGEVTDVKDAKFFAGETKNADRGWAVEVAFPWSALGGFKPEKGAKMAVEMRVNDADSTHERFKIDPTDAAENFSVTDPSTWSVLRLEE